MTPAEPYRQRYITPGMEVMVDAEDLALVLRTLSDLVDGNAVLPRPVIVAIDRMGDVSLIVRLRARLALEEK